MKDTTVCAYCKILVHKCGGRTRDHVIPKSAGGSDKRENIVICCKECNTWKVSKTLLDWLITVEFYIEQNIRFNRYDVCRLGQVRKSIKQMLAT